MKRLIKIILARLRLNKRLVCEMSRGKGMCDYHDYPDTQDGLPWHMATLKCKRCGKEFEI